jgi:hypothetical protein
MKEAGVQEESEEVEFEKNSGELCVCARRVEASGVMCSRRA